MPSDLRISLPKPRYKVEQIVEKRKHFYAVNLPNGTTEKYPGVTGILSVIAKPALIPWATKMGVESMAEALRRHKDVGVTGITDKWIDEIVKEAKAKPEKIKDDAADLGTQAHQWFDAFIRGEEAEISEKIKPAVDGFKAWIKESKLNIVGADTKVASIKHCYGGSLDALALDENEQWVLLDWKTSNACHPEYCLQVAAYKIAFEETYGIDCRRAMIVRFSKIEPVEFEVKEIKNIDVSFAAFLAAKELKNLMEIEMYV